MGKVTEISVKRSPARPVASKSMHAKPARSARLMSDVIRPPKKLAVAKAKPAQRPIKLAPAPANSLKPHKAQPATTLMRKAVTKPKPGLKKQLHVQTELTGKLADKAVAAKPSVHSLNITRFNRSQRVAKSEKVSKFAPEKKSWFSGHESAAVPIQHPADVAKAAAQPSRHSMDIFDRAIAKAKSHEQKPVHPKQVAKAAKKQARAANRETKVITAVGALFVLLIVITALGLHFRPAITLHYANTKSGFQAVLPEWTPTGYHAGKFTYRSGEVTIQYSRSGTSRQYTFSQLSSTITNETIRSKVIPANTGFQTLQNGGRTIYLYDQNNAAWISDGVLYQIVSNGNLSTSDLVSIATSIKR